ncbi:hypothetical protein GIW45_02275 [Pseudomonas congelans]|uniref:hypothetical protein n=1 Tax=Pseudomonas congelans TaxID=200452 RepID=UPI001F363C14|nr:hypothetical protein [Pseudomonas congelans]MCF5162949.1 hypothetical protein [Pseudomonas congelans]
MTPATLEFSIERYALYPSTPALTADTDLLPEDFNEWVDIKGDRFRDTFSRICFYLAERYMSPADATREETVIVGTEYGNLEAMLRFQRQARADHKSLSAQQFPYATTSSASTFVNITRHIGGGNATLNAGALTPALALLHGLLHVQSYERARSHLFVGDIYCNEALEDVRKQTPSAQISSGICYLALTEGRQFSADIRFEESAQKALFGIACDARVYLDSGSRAQLGPQCPPDDGDTGRDFSEHNRAFVFGAFLEGILALKPGQCATLLLADLNGTSCLVVSRHHE